MSKVILDTDSFLNAAAAMDDYIANCKKRNTELVNLLDELGNAWKGEDYQLYRQRFEEAILNEKTTNKQMIEYLELFSKYLKTCSKKYCNIQEQAQEIFFKC